MDYHTTLKNAIEMYIHGHTHRERYLGQNKTGYLKVCMV